MTKLLLLLVLADVLRVSMDEVEEVADDCRQLVSTPGKHAVNGLKLEPCAKIQSRYHVHKQRHQSSS